MEDEIEGGEKEFDPRKPLIDDDDEFVTGSEIIETEPEDEASLDAMIEEELEEDEEDAFDDKDEW